MDTRRSSQQLALPHLARYNQRMGEVQDVIDATVTDFIRRQHLFFVATAPLAADGHLNLSPKGLDSFAVLGPRQVAYLDLTGSEDGITAYRAVNNARSIDGLPGLRRG